MTVEYIEADKDRKIEVPENVTIMLALSSETDKLLFPFYSAMAVALNMALPDSPEEINLHKGKTLSALLQFAMEFGEVNRHGEITPDVGAMTRWVADLVTQPKGEPN